MFVPMMFHVPNLDQTVSLSTSYAQHNRSDQAITEKHQIQLDFFLVIVSSTGWILIAVMQLAVTVLTQGR